MSESYYIFSNGEIKRKDNTLQMIKEDGSKTDIPIERINDMYIFSEMGFNTKLFGILSQYGICVHMFNYYDFYMGSFVPKSSHVSGDLLVNQVLHYTNYEKRMFIAKEFINAGSYNIYRNLRYYNERGKDVSEQISQLEGLRASISDCKTISELMGIEGNIRKTYYSAWNTIINADVNFVKRVKRPPDNMINSLISFLNSVLYTKALSEIFKTQLNPCISYLHEPSDKRYSLTLDITEVFKPLIVDRLIFSLINKNIISEDDFEEEVEYLKIKYSAVKRIMQQFDDKMKTTIKHKQLNRDVSYQYLLRLEAYKLIKHIYGEKEYEGFKIWW
jgi:CRISP-associated protein Cas1